MKYRREIDGLRAVAVLPVIFFHAGFKAFSGGFVGVDVFFVISGYLITTIILADMEKGRFSIVTFYERRARRILPALFFVMLCCFPFAWMWLLPSHLKSFSKSLTAVTVFSSNVLFWLESGYFGIESELKPLLHTWSLAVEEQYYLLFPLFLMLLWKLRKRWIFATLIVISLVSLLGAQWGSYNLPTANFFLLPARGWELAIGALVAFCLLYRQALIENILRHRIVCEVLSLSGLLMIVYSIFAYDKQTPFPGVYALAPTVGAALIIVFSMQDTLVARALSTRAMVGVGLISYSAYLWHQPLFVFARHRNQAELGAGLLAVLAVASLILAYLSWRYIEIPFRDKQKIGRRKVFTFAVVGSAFFAIAGGVGRANQGFANRTIAGGVKLAEVQEKVAVNHGLSADCEESFTLSPNCRTSDEPEILVWGDSYAMHLVPGILASNPEAKIIQMTKSTCGPFFDVAPVVSASSEKWAEGCLDFTSLVRNWLQANRSVKYAVLSSPFSTYLETRNFRLMTGDKIVDADNELAAEEFYKTLKEIAAMGVHPVVFSPPPQNGKDIGQCLVTNQLFGGDLDSCNFVRTDEVKYSQEVYAFLDRIAREFDVVFIDKGFCEDGICRSNMNGTFIYRDTGHLSKEGASYLGKNMDFYGLITHRQHAQMAHSN